MRASRRFVQPPATAAVALLATLAACAGMVGCGSAASAKPPGPSHVSPAAAAVGFLQAATAAKAPEACSYVVPAQESVCTAAFSPGITTISAKNLHVGATTIAGNRALVTALGSLCTTSSGKVCFDNTNAMAGQPTAADNFDEAYSAVESGSSSNNDPAIPCTQVNGRWYVDLGEGAAGSPSTTISGPTTSTTLAPTVPSTTRATTPGASGPSSTTSTPAG
ncbi:MAG: hypothetical protein M3Y91_15035 [Actinomycetota bacterium]|nr:hypothetical protein [Actinomycetota bacterium]